MNVIGYVRLSVEDAASLSPAVQETSIRRYCDLRGLTVVEIIQDIGVSGGIPLEQRTGGKLLLARLQHGDARGVVAIKHDRIWRSVIDGLLTVERWKQEGVALHLTDMGGTALDTSTAFGWLMFCQLLAFSEAERRIIGERTRNTMKLKKTRGEKTGGLAPYGFRVTTNGETRDGVPVKHLESDPTERAFIDEMVFANQCGETPAEIAADFNRRSVPARGANGWHSITVKRIIEREKQKA